MNQPSPPRPHENDPAPNVVEAWSLRKNRNRLILYHVNLSHFNLPFFPSLPRSGVKGWLRSTLPSRFWDEHETSTFRFETLLLTFDAMNLNQFLQDRTSEILAEANDAMTRAQGKQRSLRERNCATLKIKPGNYQPKRCSVLWLSQREKPNVRNCAWRRLCQAPSVLLIGINRRNGGQE